MGTTANNFLQHYKYKNNNFRPNSKMTSTRKAPTYGSESILDLIPKPAPIKVKDPRYTSKYTNAVIFEVKKSKSSKKTMGPAKIDQPGPEKFLKKRDQSFEVVKKPQGERYHEPRKPSLPKEQNTLAGSTNKNFIKQNAVEVITSIPTKPLAIYCDTKNGNKNNFTASGLTLNYSNKKDYGKLPKYLVERNRFVEEDKKRYEEYMENIMKQKAMDKLAASERDNILKSLKEKWNSIHDEYQGLSVVTDTLSKKHKKDRLEGEMNQIERDIKCVESNQTILISKW